MGNQEGEGMQKNNGFDPLKVFFYILGIVTGVVIFRLLALAR